MRARILPGPHHLPHDAAGLQSLTTPFFWCDVFLLVQRLGRGE
jgi:hypothetical protein